MLGFKRLSFIFLSKYRETLKIYHKELFLFFNTLSGSISSKHLMDTPKTFFRFYDFTALSSLAAIITVVEKPEKNVRFQCNHKSTGFVCMTLQEMSV